MEKPMRAHYLQHVPFEGLGSMQPWLEDAGYRIGVTRLFAADPFPPIAELDLLIVMGGPMSVNDEGQFPWLIEEKAFIRAAIEAGVAVLGVCLGAQLIANAFGARVYPNSVQEIGWFPVQRTELAESGQLVLPPESMVLHWHGETFDLPAGACHLARSQGCENQAFQLGEGVIGLQFHLEATCELLDGFIEADGAALQPATYVQSAEVITERAGDFMPEAQRLMGVVLNYLHGYAAGRATR
jgi:GMP synthase-like glutamine amidotransferase